jgi:hypothetical protein
MKHKCALKKLTVQGWLVVCLHARHCLVGNACVAAALAQCSESTQKKKLGIVMPAKACVTKNQNIKAQYL